MVERRPMGGGAAMCFEFEGGRWRKFGGDDDRRGSSHLLWFWRREMESVVGRRLQDLDLTGNKGEVEPAFSLSNTSDPNRRDRLRDSPALSLRTFKLPRPEPVTSSIPGRSCSNRF